MGKKNLFIDFSKSNIDLDVYKNCASDYLKESSPPWGSPFHFLSYGIEYDEMLYFAKFSIKFIDFIFNFIVLEQKQASIDKATNFLLKAGLPFDEIKDILIKKFEGVN